MREVGIDVENRTPPKAHRRARVGAYLLVTMGCGEACPGMPRLLLNFA
jgi:hypothetical protein